MSTQAQAGGGQGSHAGFGSVISHLHFHAQAATRAYGKDTRQGPFRPIRRDGGFVEVSHSNGPRSKVIGMQEPTCNSMRSREILESLDPTRDPILADGTRSPLVRMRSRSGLFWKSLYRSHILENRRLCGTDHANLYEPGLKRLSFRELSSISRGRSTSYILDAQAHGTTSQSRSPNPR